jgi:hypothetical protein
MMADRPSRATRAIKNSKLRLPDDLAGRRLKMKTLRVRDERIGQQARMALRPTTVTIDSDGSAREKTFESMADARHWQEMMEESKAKAKALRRFVWNLTGPRSMAAMSCARPCHQVKADREPPEGLGFDACARSPTLAKGLSVKGFLACKADEQRSTCASPDGGKSGEWVGSAADTRPRFAG